MLRFPNATGMWLMTKRCCGPKVQYSTPLAITGCMEMEKKVLYSPIDLHVLFPMLWCLLTSLSCDSDNGWLCKTKHLYYLSAHSIAHEYFVLGVVTHRY